MSLERIVCYIDLDNNSRKAVRLSGAIAENRGASVEIVVAVAKNPFYGSSVGEGFVFTPRRASLVISENVMAAIGHRIEEAVQTLESENIGGDISTHRLDEHQVDALIEHARALGADLIVMSSERAGLFDRVFHRNFAERLARQSPCPVMVMPVDTEVAPPIHSVLVAVDYSEASRRAAFVAREIIDAKGVMHFQHVWEQHPIAEASPLGRLDLPSHQQPCAVDMVRLTEIRRLEEFVRNLQLTEIETKCHATSGVTHEAINDLGIDLECDVVAVGSRPHQDWNEKLFGTVTDRLIENSRKPVLTVPECFSASPPISRLERAVEQRRPAWGGPS